MKKLLIAMASAAFVEVSAGIALAACDFDIAPAKGFKASMVRDYLACSSTWTGGANVNTETEAGTNACTPVQPAEYYNGGTSYRFGPEGGCTVQMKARLIDDCSELEDGDGFSLGLQPGPCHVTYVKSKCKGIVLSDGVTPIGSSETGWSFATLSRMTFADDTNGDMTVFDIPVTFLFGTPSNGGMKLNSSSAEALVPLIGADDAALPGCTSIEIVHTVIRDPQGKPFATMGAATAP